MGYDITLSNAPIVEAVIDFRVILPDDFDVASINNIADEIKEDYPIKETHKKSNVKVAIDKGKHSVKAEDVEVSGYRFWSSDKKQVVLFTREGFTFSKLAPYSNWEQFSNEAKKLWGAL